MGRLSTWKKGASNLVGGGDGVAGVSRPVIEVAHVFKTYRSTSGPVPAIEKVDLAVRQGEFVSLVGPSGCGKSTLLLIVAGLLRPSGGRVLVDARPVDGPLSDVGVVFQNPVLLEWRNVLSNVLIQIEFRRLAGSDFEGRAQRLLASVGLEGFTTKYPWELSGGMKQRVALCRALIHNPSLLLMDEPFGALDALTRTQLNLDVQRLWLKSGKTVLFVTHSIEEAVFLSDRIVVMSARPGQIEREFEIELPRPRSLAMRDGPEFAGYVRGVREIFEAKGILHE